MKNTVIGKIWYNENIRNTLLQILLLVSIVVLFYFLYSNLQHNLKARGIASGFDFFSHRSGFNIIMHLIDYSEKSTYLDAFIVGLLNTIVVSAVSIVIATFLGLFVGIARLSHNWLWSKIALSYVEVIRNIPLLLQIFFWYFVVLRAAPFPKDAINAYDFVFLTNRGLYLPKPLLDNISMILIITCFIGLIVGHYFFKKKQSTSLLAKRFLSGFFLIIGIVGVGLLSWQVPALGRFNYEGGLVIIPEFIALSLALSIYTSSFIAEIVRMGILAVPKGQAEASLSLGLSKRQTLNLIILPQALRVIIPPLTNQYLNLTKNSSLAAAIAYPDLVAVFAGTVLNQTGQAVEIISVTMGVYLTISLTISAWMLYHEKKTNWGKK